MSKSELPEFRMEGSLWVVAYRRRQVRLRASKGLAHLSRLVGAPGARLRASDLAGRSGGADDRRLAEQDRVNVTKGIKAAVRKIAVQHPALGLHLEQGIRTGFFCSYLPVLPTVPLHDRDLGPPRSAGEEKTRSDRRPHPPRRRTRETPRP